MTDFTERAMPGIRGLRPYEPGKPVAELERELGLSDIVKLASNENPLGPSPKAVAAMREALESVALYPDGNGFELKRALAERHGVGVDQITLTNGSDHVFELVCRTFLGPGRRAVMSQYGFAIFAIAAKAASADLVMVDALPFDHPNMPCGLDPDALCTESTESDTHVVYVANPNNPTGTHIGHAHLAELVADLPDDAVVVVDEAYHEYLEGEDAPDATRLLAQHDNLIVMRTFSKAYGLAGVRVGYALASSLLTDLLNRVRLAFNPNHLAQVAAVAALSDSAHLSATLASNAEGMQQMRAGLDALGLRYMPSVCNFLTVEMGRPGPEVFQALLRQGVIVRPLVPYGLEQWLRISIGTAAENSRCLAALAQVLQR
jgi:histidinol-phosphate aminotransferase